MSLIRKSITHSPHVYARQWRPEDPEDRVLKQAVPALANRLDALADIVCAECRQVMVHGAEVSRSSLNILEDLAAGRLSFTLH